MISVIMSSLISSGANLLASAVKEKGLEYVKEKFNIDLKSINFDEPDQIKKIKNIEIEHEQELINIVFADKSNARNMNIKLNESKEASWLSKNVIPILAIFIVLLGFGLITMLIFIDIDQSKKDIVIYSLGILSAMLAQVISYFFGSSDQNNNVHLHDDMSTIMSKGLK